MDNGVALWPPPVDRTPSHETFFFLTFSSLCTHHTVAQGVARRVCIKHVHPHVITCLSVCCFLVLSSSSVSRPLLSLSHFYLFSVLNFNLHDVEYAEH